METIYAKESKRVGGGNTGLFCGIIPDTNHLIPYRVMLHEEKGDKFQIAFDCQAEDDDHAAEQALDAYPNGEILTITFFPSK